MKVGHPVIRCPRDLGSNRNNRQGMLGVGQWVSRVGCESDKKTK